MPAMSVLKSVNPVDGSLVRERPAASPADVERAMSAAERAFVEWRAQPVEERAARLRRAAVVLRERKDELARLAAVEMGKPLRDGRAEVEKCAVCCDWYAAEGPRFLAEEAIATDSHRSYVAFDPVGPVLAVMPWNFPFWQVIRFAAPNLLAGNVAVLKHASNVSGCSLALQDAFRAAGFPDGAFAALLVPGAEAERLIRHPTIRAVTLTGSEAAGRSVAAVAGSELKKTVLELGGSDAYLILEDADVERAAELCAASRLINAGQSCIAAKRFISVRSVRARFEAAFVERLRAARFGDPLQEETSMGPLARRDLRDELHAQVERSLNAGARLACGGEAPDGPGAFYPPTALTGVAPGMPAFDEETFGPVAALIEARDEEEAIALANRSRFGLGGAVFTQDRERADRVARRMECGSVAVNGFVKSDPRMPFGGVKASGYGRELSWPGLREFLNLRSVVHG